MRACVRACVEGERWMGSSGGDGDAACGGLGGEIPDSIHSFNALQTRTGVGDGKSERGKKKCAYVCSSACVHLLVFHEVLPVDILLVIRDTLEVREGVVGGAIAGIPVVVFAILKLAHGVCVCRCERRPMEKMAKKTVQHKNSENLKWKSGGGISGNFAPVFSFSSLFVALSLMHVFLSEGKQLFPFCLALHTT